MSLPQRRTRVKGGVEPNSEITARVWLTCHHDLRSQQGDLLLVQLRYSKVSS